MPSKVVIGSFLRREDIIVVNVLLPRYILAPTKVTFIVQSAIYSELEENSLGK